MKKQSRNASRIIRRLAVLFLAISLLAVAQVSLAQSDQPRGGQAAENASLSLGVQTTPAGGADFWITAASFQDFEGGFGAGWYTFRQPRDIVADSGGNFYVSDHLNGRVVKYNPTFKFVVAIGGIGKTPGKLLRHNQINIDSGNLLVADTDNSRVSVFNLNGGFIRTIGSLGTGNGQFDRPMGVAVSSTGEIFVADTWNHRIQVFSATGTYLRQWGSLGSGTNQFRYPAHLVFDDLDNLYVADSNNHRIMVYNAQGAFVRQISGFGTGPGQLKLPVGVDIGDDGLLYVADTYNYRVQKFMPNGTFVGGWGQVTGGPVISRPNGLMALGDKVYVTDIDAHRIQIFSQVSAAVDHGQVTPTSLPAGVYHVTQAPKAGWTFTGVTCTGGSPVPLANERGVSLTLVDGAAITCTFSNSQ
jgi:DNA-binding beta-propeller fold protein YncE